jgi:RND family efflux transporter MFP subunit
MAQPGLSLRWYHVITGVVAVVLLGGAGWYAYAWAKPQHKNEESHAAGPHHPNAGGVTVEVVKPQSGGIQRRCTQPGTVEPFESADVYAKVSGYLLSQMLEREVRGPDGRTVAKPVMKDGKPVVVNIGTRVQAGDILARISVPEDEKQVERAEAQLKDVKAKVKQMEAHLEAAKAESRAATASVALHRVMVKVKIAYRDYRAKQLERIKGLVAEKALDAKLLDEQEDHYLSAQEAENAAHEQVNTASEQANAAKAKIAQAEADLEEAKALVGVYEAELGKAKVQLDYTVIRAKYTGVITRRTFFPGDFIKAADQGGNVPMLTVERTDVMTVVVQVPDRDVPVVNSGDPAVIEVDALPGVVIKSDDKRTVVVARTADAEDPVTRTMRTEIDVPNTDGLLRHGMYGRVTIVLTEGAKGSVRIPSAALVGKAEDGKGTVRVLRGGKVHISPVRYAADNGIEVEVVSGLTSDDEVITRASAAVEEGTPATVYHAGGH